MAASAGRPDVMSLTSEGLLEQRLNAGLVINNKNAAAFRARSRVKVVDIGCGHANSASPGSGAAGHEAKHGKRGTNFGVWI